MTAHSQNWGHGGPHPRRVRPVILSGGSGTRLWPLSRQDWPKQLLPLTGDQTLLQLTALRTSDNADFANPIVVANQRHGDAILGQLAAVGVAPDKIILEPAGRNTAPAIALAAFHAQPDDILVVMPSDHVIRDKEGFQQALATAIGLADDGWLVTLGLTPTRAETGFGYIRPGAPLPGGGSEVAQFVEKPPLVTAEAYLADGKHLWNSGIFVFSAFHFRAALRDTAPAVHSAVSASVANARSSGAFLTPDAAAFEAAPSISVDYAVMEKAERVAVVPADIGWSDVGSWDALHEFRPADDQGNRVQGEVILCDTSGCSILSAGPVVATMGVKDLTIIATGDAVLIIPVGRSQEIESLVQQLRARKSSTLAAWPGEGVASLKPDSAATSAKCDVT